MSGGYFSMFDMAIAGVPALVFGIWQLVSINREIAKDKAKQVGAKRESPESGSPRSSGHPVGEHRLDDR